MRYLVVFLALIPLVFDPASELPYEPPKVFLITFSIFFSILVVGVLFLKKRQDLPRGTVLVAWQPLDVAVAGYALALGASTFFSQDPWLSFFGSEERMIGLYYYLSLFALYFLVRWAGKKENWKFFLRTTMLVATLVSLYAIAQWFDVDLSQLKHAFPLYGMYGPTRAFSTFGHPNFLGAYLAMVLPFGWYLWKQEIHRGSRYVGLCAAVLSVPALYVTYSRGAWLAMIAAVIVMGMFWKPHTRRWYLCITVAICVLLGLMGGTVWFLRSVTPDTNNAGLYRVVSTVDWRRGSTLARLNEWKFALPLFLNRPWLGYGFDTYYDFAIQREKDPGESSPDFQGADPSVADRLHNIFLDTMWASGLIGLLAFLSVFAFAGRKIVEQCRFAPLRPWTVTLAASLVAYLVGNFFSFDFSISGLLFFLLLAGIQARPPV